MVLSPHTLSISAARSASPPRGRISTPARSCVPAPIRSPAWRPSRTIAVPDPSSSRRHVPRAARSGSCPGRRPRRQLCRLLAQNAATGIATIHRRRCRAAHRPSRSCRAGYSRRADGRAASRNICVAGSRGSRSAQRHRETALGEYSRRGLLGRPVTRCRAHPGHDALRQVDDHLEAHPAFDRR